MCLRHHSGIKCLSGGAREGVVGPHGLRSRGLGHVGGALPRCSMEGKCERGSISRLRGALTFRARVCTQAGFKMGYA